MKPVTVVELQTIIYPAAGVERGPYRWHPGVAFKRLSPDSMVLESASERDESVCVFGTLFVYLYTAPHSKATISVPFFHHHN